MTNVSKYPVDYDTLEQGDVISVDQIEALTQQRFGTIAYSMEAMKLQQRMMDDLRGVGKPWTIKNEKGALVVLTDEQASEYNDQRCRAQIRGFGRSLGRLRDCDNTNMSDDHRRSHERRVESHGRTFAAIVASRKKRIVSEPHKRALPNE